MDLQKNQSCAITHKTVLKCVYNFFYIFFTKLNCGSFCFLKILREKIFVLRNKIEYSNEAEWIQSNQFRTNFKNSSIWKKNNITYISHTLYHKFHMRCPATSTKKLLGYNFRPSMLI